MSEQRSGKPLTTIRECLAELLRLYDWRFELAEMERAVEIDGELDKRALLKRLLNQYGHEKKHAWQRARELLAAPDQSADKPRTQPDQMTRDVEAVAADMDRVGYPSVAALLRQVDAARKGSAATAERAGTRDEIIEECAKLCEQRADDEAAYTGGERAGFRMAAFNLRKLKGTAASAERHVTKEK